MAVVEGMFVCGTWEIPEIDVNELLLSSTNEALQSTALMWLHCYVPQALCFALSCVDASWSTAQELKALCK